VTENNRHLFLGGVAYKATERDIREAIEDEGIMVDNVRLGLDRDTGRSRGFAFVDIASSETRSLPDLITALTGIEVCGRACRVEMASEKPERAPRSFRKPPRAHTTEARGPSNPRQRRRREREFERPWRNDD
jgi:RNA recognition motif-containing protein